MPSQLIYTSASRGLTPGQSGFCTVARSRHLREALASRIEQISAYNHLVSSTSGAERAPRIHAYRILDLRATRYHVLTRIVDAGLDFTSRTNHLAHHLILQPQEIASLPSPAVILARWDGWLDTWSGAPSLMDDQVAGNLGDLPRAVSLPAEAWRLSTGDGGRAAALLEPEHLAGCHLLVGPGNESELLDLFAETLQLLSPDGRHPARCWRYSFTTFLQGEDNPADFRWRGCWPDTPAHLTAVRGGLTPLGPASLTVPTGELAELARTGRVQSPPAPATPSARRQLALAGVASRNSIRQVRRLSAPHSPASRLPVRQVIASRPRPARTFGLRIALGVAVLLAAGAFAFLFWPGSRPAPPLRVASAPPDAAGASDPRTESQGHEDEPTRPAGGSASVLHTVESSLPGSIPTWLLILGPDADSIQLGPPIPAIDDLLRRVLLSQDEDGAIGTATIDCRRDPVTFGFPADDAGDPIRVELIRAGAGPRLVFADDAREATVATIPLNARYYSNRTDTVLFEFDKSVRTEGLALSFRPVPGMDSAFAPFRLLVLDPATAPSPIHLPKSIFQTGQPNPLSGLDQTLRDRLEGWTPMPGWRWQTGWFYEGAGGPNPSPFTWPSGYPEEATYDAPATLARQLDARIEEGSRRMMEIRDRLQQIQRDYEEGRVFDPHWPMGELVGKSRSEAYYSFAKTAEINKYTNSPPSTGDLNGFVRGFLIAAGWKSVELPDKLVLEPNSAPRRNDVRFIQEAVEALARKRHQSFPDMPMPPQNYLVSAYMAFKEAETNRIGLQRLRRGETDMRWSRNLFPTNITRVTHVSLMLVPDRDRSPGMEVIRFVDIQPEETP